MEPPSFSVKEICRERNLSPASVVKYLASSGSIATPTNLDSQDSCEWYQEIRKPKPSKAADKIRSEIWREGQRYERRFQFPSSPIPKTTSRKADARIVSQQLEGVNFKPRTQSNAKQPIAQKESTKECFQPENQEAKEKTEGFMESIRANSVVPIERPGRVQELIYQGTSGSKTPIITNWICPRGTDLDFDQETKKVYRLYTLTDPQQGFETDYQILPRLNLERNLCRQLERFQTNALYVKIVANDNPYCLYPACLRIDGEIPTMAAISKYTQYCQSRFDKLIERGSILVTTWSQVLGPRLFAEYLKVYEETALADLMPHLPANIVNIMIDILTDHTKPDPKLMPYFETFATSCIRYFAVEGLFLYKIFGDDVILAWNDSTRIANAIDALRLKNGLPPLPKIYVLHEKRKGKIIDNF